MTRGMVSNGVRGKIKSRSVRHILNMSHIAMVLATVLTFDNSVTQGEEIYSAGTYIISMRAYK